MLWGDLAPLDKPDALAGNQQLSDAARGALSVLAHYATEIARAWEAWTAPPTHRRSARIRPTSAARFPVHCRNLGEGHVRVSMHPVALGACDGPSAAPTVQVRRVQPAAAGGARAAQFAAAGGAPEPAASSSAMPDLVLTHRTRSLNLLNSQNIRGYVDIEPNRDLLPDRATHPEFVYAIDRAGPGADLAAPDVSQPLRHDQGGAAA